MALLDDTQRLYAMYVIGKVESGHNWASVNYADPITIGMLQWYGTRAAALLDRLKGEQPDDYAKLSESLRSSLDAHAAAETWWTTRYLTRAEGESWAACAESDGNHAVQQTQFFEDMAAYEQVFEGWGMASPDPRCVVYVASMYHQGPRYAGQVVTGVGVNAGLDRLHRACLNNGVLGVYKNRYNTVYGLLKDWDGASAPPDFGQVDMSESESTNPSASSTGTTAQASGIRCIQTAGSDLLVRMTDGSSYLCYEDHGLWRPRSTSSAPANPTNGTGTGESAASGDFSKMIQLWYDHEKEFAYGQGPGRLTPLTSGYTDCSACIWWAINEVRPDLAKGIGTWTGALMNCGTEIARGANGARIPTDKLKPGDIVLCNWKVSNYNFADGHSHVEWYVGNGDVWGAGSAPCPKDNGDVNAYMSKAKCWMVRRIF